MEYQNIRLKDIVQNKENLPKIVEVEGTPITVKEKKSFLDFLLGPKWTAVIEDGDVEIIAKRSRFGSTFFHTEEDLIMLIYACENRIPVTFRGSLKMKNRVSAIPESRVPVLKVNDYKFKDYRTYGYDFG